MCPGPFTVLESSLATAALETALTSGLLGVLERTGPKKVTDLAARAHLDERGVRLLVDALTQLGITQPRDSIDCVELVGTVEGWQKLADISPRIRDLVEGRPVCSDASTPSEYRAIVELLSRMTASIIEPWAQARAATGLRLLEVGCGDAPWTRSLAQLEDSVLPTLIDHPVVLQQTADRLRASFPTLQLELLAGDAHATDIAGPYDLIILSGFCRLFDDQTNARLIARLSAALDPDGELLILDAIEFDESEALSLYRLSLAARHQSGRTHSIEHYRSWLHDGGLEAPSITHSLRPELTLLSTRRRTEAIVSPAPVSSMHHDHSGTEDV